MYHVDIMTWQCCPHYWLFMRVIHWSPVMLLWHHCNASYVSSYLSHCHYTCTLLSTHLLSLNNQIFFPENLSLRDSSTVTFPWLPVLTGSSVSYYNVQPQIPLWLKPNMTHWAEIKHFTFLEQFLNWKQWLFVDMFRFQNALLMSNSC